MIIYNETSSNFLNHIYENKIGYVLKENVFKKMNKVVSPSELNSWERSLPQMAKVLRDAPNQAFREILRKKLIGASGHMEVRDLFKGSAAYVEAPENYFDVLICDEAIV
ncbi:hypothetical protein [Bacillus sp. B15-48]|uniref:hypothetical protein n=1 Tax=Bacillus sp. B15-48 TaxID=1548601 RepID=UPI001EF3AE87|nr:hypothetical protein [Bacillus sp. B15-48]